MDFARRWTAASLKGVGRSIPKASCLQVLGDVKPLGIRLTLTVLQPWSRKGMGGVVKIIWPVENWFNEGQTATGTMARCTLNIVLHYHATIKVKQHEQNTPPVTVSGMLTAKAATTGSGHHGYPMVTKPLNLGRYRLMHVWET